LSGWGRGRRGPAAAVAALAATAAVGVLALLPAKPARAWKPSTHVALAEYAIEEALATGYVTIATLERRNTDGVHWYERKPLGRYAVDPKLLNALRTRRAHFRAGVLGPDAYPDILTGQRLIHDDGHDELAHGEPPQFHPVTGARLNLPNYNPFESGANSYLTSVYNGVGLYPNSAHVDSMRAFAFGFLVHAAGDMFIHDYINHFAGGPFEIGPNAIKHVILEGYLAERGPKLTATAMSDYSIDGLDQFIYDRLVDASFYRGKPTGDLSPGAMFRFYQGRGLNTATSLPAVFSKLADQLCHDIESLKGSVNPLKIAEREYKEAWLEDIVVGLRAWPKYSHKVAYHLMIDPEPDGGKRRDKVSQVLADYVTDHLISMSGAPDAIGDAAGAAVWVARTLSDLGLMEPIKEMQRDFVNYMFRKHSGKSLDEWVKIYTHPSRYFDQILGPGSPGEGERITKSDLNRDHLGVADVGDGQTGDSWTPDTFAPAYNTVVATKLALLGEAEQKRLLADLKNTNVGAGPVKNNALLGFIRSLDASAQWRVKEDRGGIKYAANWLLFDARIPGGTRVFDKLFYPMLPGRIVPRPEQKPGEQTAEAEGTPATTGGTSGTAGTATEKPPATSGLLAALGERTRGKVGETLTDTLWDVTVTTVREASVYTRRNAYYGETKVEAGKGETLWLVECDLKNRQPRDQSFAFGDCTLEGTDGSSVDVTNADLLHGGTRFVTRAFSTGSVNRATLIFTAPAGFRPRAVRMKVGNTFGTQTQLTVTVETR